MIDLPLHPIAVHFPIAFGVLIPIMGLVLIWAINTKRLPSKVWTLMIFLAALYFGSAIGVIQLGEIDEEIVEHVVQESVIESHEEAGELMAWVSGILLFAFMLPVFFRNGSKYRVAAVVLSVAGLIPLVRAGHTGGELVYKHNAAKAHLDNGHQVDGKQSEHSEEEDDDDEHHHHQEGNQKLSLNDGKKWPTDKTLRENMKAIKSYVLKRKDKIHGGKMSEKEYHELGATIGSSVEAIFKNCKLPPKADAQLHAVLIDVLKAKENFLKTGADHKEAVGVLHNSLVNYEKYFNQSEQE